MGPKNGASVLAGGGRITPSFLCSLHALLASICVEAFGILVNISSNIQKEYLAQTFQEIWVKRSF
jgi:hypothetical protein